jgi:hypothetical protein
MWLQPRITPCRKTIASKEMSQPDFHSRVKNAALRRWEGAGGFSLPKKPFSFNVALATDNTLPKNHCEQRNESARLSQQGEKRGTSALGGSGRLQPPERCPSNSIWLQPRITLCGKTIVSKEMSQGPTFSRAVKS